MATIETFASISSADIELGAALTDIEWLSDPTVSPQTKDFWFRSFLDVAPFPNVSVLMASLPWVLKGHTSDRRVAQNDSAFLEGLLELPWVRDDISSAESVAIQEIIELRSDTTQSLLENAWFLDDLTLAESTLISRLATISGVEPDLPLVLLDLEWTKDGISENDKRAIGLLALLDQPTAGIVTTVPWFITASVEDQDINLLKAIAKLFAISPKLSVQAAGIDFFRDSAKTQRIGRCSPNKADTKTASPTIKPWC